MIGFNLDEYDVKNLVIKYANEFNANKDHIQNLMISIEESLNYKTPRVSFLNEEINDEYTPGWIKELEEGMSSSPSLSFIHLSPAKTMCRNSDRLSLQGLPRS
jgi:hypothetical protein